MKNKNSENTQSNTDFLNDLRALVTNAEALLTGPDDESSEEQITTLRDRIDAAQARVGEIYAGTKKQVIAGAKSTDEAIRANPYQTLFLALGAGLLIGAIAGRRSR
jgi:ElaB/YqjD/DUF883 family membrane-anchored ribosome-binding protein